MNAMTLFLYEWKHFLRNPFKVVALILFVLVGIYGLHNGANLYKTQNVAIEKIQTKAKEEQQKILAYYEKGEKGPEDRPWVDVTIPFWAVWYAPTYHFKKPSPALVYSIGQAEQYGFYKNITFWSSPYDADMAEEIANPERLQTGTLDFAFVILYLLPLLLLILLYNIKGAEAEQGFLPLIEVQVHSKNGWLLSRVAFYSVVVLAVLVSLIFYGAALTPVFTQASSAISQMILYALIYLSLWVMSYFFILRSGKSIMGNTLKMVGVWLLFAFIIPATVHQWVSIAKPANLMTDVIDAQRDDLSKLREQPDSVIQTKLDSLFPEITNSPTAKDKRKSNMARNRSNAALANQLMKEGIAPISKENQARNQLIKATFWFSPFTFFQNQLNKLSKTHYIDYQQYRDDIQQLIDQQIKVMVVDTWNEIKVDKEKYLEYSDKK
jgi:ABC-2 type transport system permease protein